eukprot:gene1361-7353_t
MSDDASRAADGSRQRSAADGLSGDDALMHGRGMTPGGDDALMHGRGMTPGGDDALGGTHNH